MKMFAAALFLVGTILNPAPNHPGAEPYTPSRIDWFTTTLQANYRVEDPELHYSLDYYVIDSTETVVIMVRYDAAVKRESMTRAIASAHRLIEKNARIYGFQDWINVKEDVQPFGTK